MAEAQGEYLAFIDSDDFWLPDKLTLQYQLLEQNKCVGLAFSNFSTFGDDGRVLTRRHQIPTDLYGAVYPRLLQTKNNVVVTPSVVARRDLLSALGGFDESMRICEDIDLWHRCSKRADVMFVDRELTAVHLRTEPLPYEASLNARIKLYRKAVALDPGLAQGFLMELYSELLEAYKAAAEHRRDLEVLSVFQVAKERLLLQGSPIDSSAADQIFASALEDLGKLSA
jgi:hypothetical protein